MKVTGRNQPFLFAAPFIFLVPVVRLASNTSPVTVVRQAHQPFAMASATFLVTELVEVTYLYRPPSHLALVVRQAHQPVEATAVLVTVITADKLNRAILQNTFSLIAAGVRCGGAKAELPAAYSLSDSAQACTGWPQSVIWLKAFCKSHRCWK